METIRKTTLADIARALGLDKSSVSLALRGSARISGETRDKVRKMAAELGYQPNAAARQLRVGGPLAVGLVLPSSFATLGSHVAVAVIQGIAKLAFAKGALFALMPSPGTGAAPFVPDGLLLWGDTPLEDVGPLLRNGCPFVVLDPNHPSYRDFAGAAVRIDNQGGAAAMVEHLVGQGAERLLFVKACGSHLGHEERWEGARSQWLKDRPLHTVSCCMLEELTDAHLLAFAAEPKGAVFCSNDDAAVKVWHKLARLGVKPGSVALAGFDGIPQGEDLGLATVVVDAAAFARLAFDTLAAAMGKLQDAPRFYPTLPVVVRAGGTTFSGG